jgi:hypothetical protein
LVLTPLVIAIHASELPQMKGAELRAANPPPALPPATVNVVVPPVIAPKPDCSSPATKEVRPALDAPEPPPRRFSDLRRMSFNPNAAPAPLTAAEALVARLEARCNPQAPQPAPPTPVPMKPEELARNAATLDELGKQLAELK